jgi:serine protease Do
VSANELTLAGGLSVVVEKIKPTVVNISSTRIVRNDQGPAAPFFSDPFFRQFFGEGSIPRTQKQHSLGSGVIVSPDGYLLTNNHVVEGATDVQVFLSDKREFKARTVGVDAKTDVAVLKIDAKNLPVATFADSARVRVGDFVLAAGDPFGIGQTFTLGIVSATGRGGLGIEDYEDFIQTDAAINPGNSGGALVNVQGELIGINTAIISGQGGGNQGIGFAIPINMARQTMDQILKHGKVVRGWLGITVQPVSASLAKGFGLKEARGALVGDVTPDGPAAKVGLQRGDIVLALDGQPIADSRNLSLKIAGKLPGTVVKLNIFRTGAEKELSVQLAEMPSKAEEAGREAAPEGTLQGLSVDDLSTDIDRQLGLPSGTAGVVVTDVEPDSAAADADLRRGDVIQEVNHVRVRNTTEFERAVRQADRQPVLLLVNRNGSTLFVAVEP